MRQFLYIQGIFKISFLLSLIIIIFLSINQSYALEGSQESKTFAEVFPVLLFL